MARLTIAGWLLVLAGLGLARWKAPGGDVSAIRFALGDVAVADGRVVQVDATPWEMPAKKAGLGPLPVYLVSYRFLDAAGNAHDGRSYTQGLWHKIRDGVRVEYLAGEPEISRIQKYGRRPFGPERLLWLLAPLPGLLVVLAGRWRGGKGGRVGLGLAIACLLGAAEVVRAVLAG